jgi:hypothetical protein
MMTDKAIDELNELVVAEGLHANNVEKVSRSWRPFSLTKYCAIFAEVKECFGIMRCNNKLGVPVVQQG